MNFDSNKRVIFISYRLPREVSKEELHESVHWGLQNAAVATSIAATRDTDGYQGRNVLWVGCPNSGSRYENDSRFVCIHLDPELARLHFSVFCKGLIWPLFHYYEKTYEDFSPEAYIAYKTVNQKFADIVASVYREGDLIFVQDYHLMMVPAMIREKVKGAKIAFFLHTPFPSSEIYRTLPVRSELLHGLLGADIVGFQTYPYLRHFLSSCTRLLGLSVTDATSCQKLEASPGHFTTVEVIPVGIDPDIIISTTSAEATKAKIQELKQAFAGKKVIVSRDRIEHTKGIPLKLRAFEAFLEQYPEWVGKVVLYQECRPNLEVTSRGAQSYLSLVEEIEQLVGAINGKFSTMDYIPIHYLNKHLKWEDTCALFCAADVALITPLRDGMNLTSHEFVVCQEGNYGVLILSEFAGSAQCLSGAILVNPWDIRGVVKSMHSALTMPLDKRMVRHKHNLDYIRNHNTSGWVKGLLKHLLHTEVEQPETVLPLDSQVVLDAYHKAQKRVILLDYDGTLTPIVKNPSEATLTPKMLSVIQKLVQDPRNRVYIVSGRDRPFLLSNLADLPVGMSCEHGCFFRPCPTEGVIPEWEDISTELDLSWKETIKRILEDCADSVPGSFVEEKEVNLTWHYRNADPFFGEFQKNELCLHLQALPGLPIDVLVGKKDSGSSTTRNQQGLCGEASDGSGTECRFFDVHWR